MSKLWKTLNAPLVVVLIALSVWPILTILSSVIAVKLGIEQLADAVSEEVVKPFQNMNAEQDDELKTEVAILEKMTVSNIAFAPTSWTEKIKIIGTITNNSTQTVKGIHATSSLYQNDTLVNVEDTWFSKIKSIGPNSSANFNFVVSVDEGQSKENLTAEIKISDLSLLE